MMSQANLPLPKSHDGTSMCYVRKFTQKWGQYNYLFGWTYSLSSQVLLRYEQFEGQFIEGTLCLGENSSQGYHKDEMIKEYKNICLHTPSMH